MLMIKQKYDTLNQLFLLDRISLSYTSIPILLNIFNPSLNNDDYVNYLCSYIIYNKLRFHNLQSIFVIGIKKYLYKKKITTLYLSGDIPIDNIINACTKLSAFDKIICLNISDNKNLMSLDFVNNLPNLETINAQNCNILFVEKTLLELNNLKKINLDGNNKLSFDNLLELNEDTYTLDEIEYLILHNYKSNMISYDDDTFRTHFKYSIFLKYIIDYNFVVPNFMFINNSKLNNRVRVSNRLSMPITQTTTKSTKQTQTKKKHRGI